MPLSVLIVEDDAAFQKIVEIRLKGWRTDLQIRSANSIGKARELLDAETTPAFELVVLDQNLPDGLGWELLEHSKLGNCTVLAVSADDSPELPGQTVRAGAQHFLAKRQVTEPLFIPLLDALLERRNLEKELIAARLKSQRMETIKVLLATLRHEINNPLGAVFGGAYLLKNKGQLDESQQEAIRLIESSSKRIKHVLEELCQTADLEEVTKAHEQVFQIPGDRAWESK